ncbi:MAG TPA: CopD family protein [Miltoncostaeaceae bacterium]|nr:CopD family protein [Miltoncostaeaceae bacterium]
MVPLARPSTRGLSLVAALMLLVVAAVHAPRAEAHAVPVAYSPGKSALVADAGGLVTVRFSEPVTLLNPDDLRVVDEEGESLATGPARVSPNDARTIEVPVRGDLEDGTYTVSYRPISADAHVVPGIHVFGVGPGPVGEPYLGGAVEEGPSETSPWAVGARFLELVLLGGLAGLVLFRPLVWAPVWRRRAATQEDVPLLGWGRDALWGGVAALAIGAIVAEAFLLIVYTAQVNGTAVSDALSASAIGTTLSGTELGGLLQLRAGLLFVIFLAASVVVFQELDPTRGEATLLRGVPTWSSWTLGAGAVVVLAVVSAQGHASQAPAAALQVAADAVHLAAVGIWATGLALTVLCLWRLPRLGATGAARATEVLARFSRVATLAILAVALTGTVRAFGELSAPAQLWGTAYGQSLLLKLALLLPIGALALQNRRVLRALERIAGRSAVGLARVRRTALAELAIGLVVVAVAAVLVAQTPGRAVDRGPDDPAAATQVAASIPR